MPRIILAICLSFIALPLLADSVLPERRLVFSRDTDFFGSDLAPIFETDRAACERVCLADSNCAALTFNTKSQACFPKSGIDAREPFEGAMSAQVVVTPQSDLAAAGARFEALSALSDTDAQAARAQALTLGSQFVGETGPSTFCWTRRAPAKPTERFQTRGIGLARPWPRRIAVICGWNSPACLARSRQMRSPAGARAGLRRRL
ncbi:PAN/Apple domain-containing protein [Roseobacteraceae bacterium S113]